MGGGPAPAPSTGPLCPALTRAPGHSHCWLQFTQHTGHAIELARQAAEEGRPLVVAVGGDGTLSEVLLVGSSAMDTTLMDNKCTAFVSECALGRRGGWARR